MKIADAEKACMKARLKKLEEFYKDIIDLTINHDVLKDNAVVYPINLDKALCKVNPKWYDNA